MLCRSFIVGGLVLFCVACAPAAPAKSDLTIQARAVLRKYCADCHHPDAGHFGEISVLDRAGLERAGRPFLLPGKPTASQILQLIDGGSMPPGNRDKPNEVER